MGLGTHLWSLGPILHPETCVLVLDPLFWVPTLHQVRTRGKTERLGAPGQDRACTRGAPNMHQGALGPHVSAGRCARGGVWAPRCRRDTARTRRPVQVHARRPGRVHTRRPSKVRAPGRAHTWRTGRTSRGRVCTLDGGGWPGVDSHVGPRFAKYTLRQAHNGCDHTSVSAPDPIRTPQLSALGPE
ncbi:hypothetical protein SUGI_1246520 [Cryptomeria japonica]|uniref:Uncharacterized protein n=1 Tax=Cryptomeria japonica TaxID=3369 RepID=A0AAD3NNB7_CRYJA|nr:hypothetical protein SUGI_1246520 [Cryptomeria japonica]